MEKKKYKMFDIETWPTLGELLYFQLYLLRLGSRFTGEEASLACRRKIHEMVLINPYFLYPLVSKIRVSPRLAYHCLLILLELPEDMLENSLIVKSFVCCGDSNIAKEEFRKCLYSIVMCFGKPTSIIAELCYRFSSNKSKLNEARELGLRIQRRAAENDALNEKLGLGEDREAEGEAEVT